MSQTSTIMYVSKAHQQTVKRLYKIIFKLHKSLPKELEEIGNSYVRHEFKLHKNAKPEQVKIFMSEWGNYTKLLIKQVNPRFGLQLGKNLEDKLDDFNDSQITQLYELFLETKKEKRLNNPPPSQS